LDFLEIVTRTAGLRNLGRKELLAIRLGSIPWKLFGRADGSSTNVGAIVLSRLMKPTKHFDMEQNMELRTEMKIQKSELISPIEDPKNVDSE
jgi:hypothetical protein